MGVVLPSFLVILCISQLLLQIEDFQIVKDAFQGIREGVIVLIGSASFVIILLISGCYHKFQNSSIIKSIMAGLQPAVVALIAAALLSASRSVFDMGDLFAEDNLISAAIVLSAGFLCYKKKHPIIVIGMSALAGMIFGMLV